MSKLINPPGEPSIYDILTSKEPVILLNKQDMERWAIALYSFPLIDLTSDKAILEPLPTNKQRDRDIESIILGDRTTYFRGVPVRPEYRPVI